MQHHDLSKVSTMRRTDRLRPARTPDRSEVRNMDLSTMSCKFASPKRSVHTSRVSMANPSLNSTFTSLRKMELENNNLELELAYSQYVASYAELILEQKNFKDTKVSRDNSIKKAHKETQYLMNKCKLIETRVNDVEALSYLNDYIDSVQTIIKKFQDQLQKPQSILKPLSQLLDRFSILRCENIILPKTPEEMEQFKETLDKCNTILTEIDSIMKTEELENIIAEYKEILRLTKEINSIKNIVEEKICTLQSEKLKSCAKELSQSEEDCDSKQE